MAQIAIVDDHPIVASAIADLLTSFERYHVQYICHSLDEFMQAQTRGASDMLLLDIALKDSNSVAVLPSLLLDFPALDIIVFSMFDTPPYINTVLTSGAKGFVSKSRLHVDLPLAVERVLAGGEFFEVGTHVAMSPGCDLRFTEREREVLRLVVLGATPKGIAQTLGCASKTVHAHMANIANKIGSRDRAVWRQSAQAEGIVSLADFS